MCISEPYLLLYGLFLCRLVADILPQCRLVGGGGVRASILPEGGRRLAAASSSSSSSLLPPSKPILSPGGSSSKARVSSTPNVGGNARIHSGPAPSTPTDISGSLPESRVRSPSEGRRPIASSSSASHLESSPGGGTSQEVIVGGEDHTTQRATLPTSYHSGGEGGEIGRECTSSSGRSGSSQRLSSTGGHSLSQPATPRLSSSLSGKEQPSQPHHRDPLHSLSSKSSPLSSVERRRQGVGVQRDGMTTEKRSVSYPCVSLEALKLWLDQGRPHKAVWVSSLPCAERLLSRGLGLQAELGKVLHEIEEEARKEKNLQEQKDKEKETRKQGGSGVFDERSKERKERDAITEDRGESQVEQEGEGGGNFI